MSKINYMTEEGLRKLKDELEHLEKVERPAISLAIAEAREKGDISENAEYDAAKDEQGMIEMKIAKLQETISNFKIIDNSKIDTTTVRLLNKVKIKNKKNNAVMEYTIVPETEANLKEAKISVTSPIAKALLGKKKGEKVDVTTPSGVIPFEIVGIFA